MKHVAHFDMNPSFEMSQANMNAIIKAWKRPEPIPARLDYRTHNKTARPTYRRTKKKTVRKTLLLGKVACIDAWNSRVRKLVQDRAAKPKMMNFHINLGDMVGGWHFGKAEVPHDYPRPQYYDQPEYLEWRMPPLKNESTQNKPSEVDEKTFLVYRLEKDGYGPARHPKEGFHINHGGKLSKAYNESNLTRLLSRTERDCNMFFSHSTCMDDVRYASPSIPALIEYWTEEFVHAAIELGFTIQAYEVKEEIVCCPNGWQVAYPRKAVKQFLEAA